MPVKNQPTPEEIQAEAKRLRELKPSIPPRTIFGDDNHAAIDAQIETLEKGLSYAQILDAFDEPDEDDVPVVGGYVSESAMDAYRWRSGALEQKLSDDWQTLLPAEK